MGWDMDWFKFKNKIKEGLTWPIFTINMLRMILRLLEKKTKVSERLKFN
jgi:hypothetical protein